MPTLCMTSAWSITRSVGAPRAAFVDFPLGHTTGRPHEPELQEELLRRALAGFASLEAPGAILSLPFVWSADESWRERALSSSEGGGGDFRSERFDTPQYQSADDERAARRAHEAGACGLCVGAE